MSTFTQLRSRLGVQPALGSSSRPWVSPASVLWFDGWGGLIEVLF